MFLILEASHGKQARLEPKSSGHRRKLELLHRRMAHERAGMKQGPAICCLKGATQSTQ